MCACVCSVTDIHLHHYYAKQHTASRERRPRQRRRTVMRSAQQHRGPHPGRFAVLVVARCGAALSVQLFVRLQSAGRAGTRWICGDVPAARRTGERAVLCACGEVKQRLCWGVAVPCALPARPLLCSELATLRSCRLSVLRLRTCC